MQKEAEDLYYVLLEMRTFSQEFREQIHRIFSRKMQVSAVLE